MTPRDVDAMTAVEYRAFYDYALQTERERARQQRAAERRARKGR